MQARLLGSQNHSIHPYKAALSATHAALVSLAFLSPSLSDASSEPGSAQATAGAERQRPALKFNTETSLWGRERVTAGEVEDWEGNREQGKQLAERCERLYQTFLGAEG